jgi:hypothetical protein
MTETVPPLQQAGKVRKRIVRELPNSLSKGKHHSEEDRKQPVQMERLRRVPHALIQYAGFWKKIHRICYFFIMHLPANTRTDKNVLS